jgi:anaerobic magnesium-protoporphyrin IX monomethyl ester cyclase
LRVLLISTACPLEENPLPPLSLTYLASVLERENIEVQILDFLVTHYTPQTLRKKLEEYRPHLVGVGCVTMNYPFAARMLKVCKAFDSGIFTVIGGPHVSFTLNETLLRAPWIDAVVIGEGERTLVELAKAVAGGNDIGNVAGIAFADGNRVVKTEPRALIEELDQLPLPARHLLPLARYRALGTPCTLITSRGCPYGCIFCSAHRMFGRKIRFRDPGLVVDEIEMIHRDFGFPHINIVDDTFTANHEHARQVCEEMLRRNLKIDWSAFTRADRVTDDMVALMKRAGCDLVLFGVESADENILKTIRKGITPEDVRRGVKIATSAGVRVFASYILGLPGESPETIRKSMAFADEIGNTYGAEYAFHILAPLPGTELFEKINDYGLRILSRNWARYDANQPITESATIRREMIWEAMANYDRVIESAWVEVRSRAAAGDDACIRRLEGIESQKFVWSLLQSDIIDRLGEIKAVTTIDPVDAQEELTSRIARRLNLPLDTVRQETQKLVRAGFLQLAPGVDNLRWQWSSSLNMSPQNAPSV